MNDTKTQETTLQMTVDFDSLRERIILETNSVVQCINKSTLIEDEFGEIYFKVDAEDLESRLSSLEFQLGTLASIINPETGKCTERLLKYVDLDELLEKKDPKKIYSRKY